MRFKYLLFAGLLLSACSGDNPSENSPGTNASSGGDGGSGGKIDDMANADGDCMTDAEELALGTDPNAVDTDLDGVSDCDEIACVSNPTDAAEVCYACGWKHNDPGDLMSTGTTEGSVIANVELIDQCNQNVPLWDLAGQYYIMFMTAAW